MAPKLVQKASSEYLRLAQAHLICRIDPGGDLGVRCTPYIREIDRGTDEVLDEGYDPHHSPLGSPVFWRVINRGDEQFYCNTFLATRTQVIKAWGTQGQTTRFKPTPVFPNPMPIHDSLLGLILAHRLFFLLISFRN
jgi:hypothetical protein